jgi:hypothetical protein
MEIFRCFFNVFWVLGAPQNRRPSYHKSVGIRDLFGSIEGGALPGSGPSSLRARKGQKDEKDQESIIFPFIFGKTGEKSENTYKITKKTLRLAGGP